MIALVLCVVFAHKYKDKENIIYLISIFILWVILSIRYGQGTDYFSYNILADMCDNLKQVVYNYKDIHSEIGMRLLYFIFHGNFTLLIFVVSTYQMYMLHRFIWRYSMDKMLTLAMFYPMFAMVFYFSVIRQGIVIATFLGVMYGLLKRGEIKKYCIVCICLSTIHVTALVLLCFPLIVKLSKKQIEIMFIASIVCAVLLQIIYKLNGSLGFEKLDYYYNSDLHVLGILSKIFMLVFVVILYVLRYKLTQNDCLEIRDEMKIFISGFSFYIAFLAFQNVGTRLIIYFNTMLLIIVPYLFTKKIEFRKTLLGILMAYLLVMNIKTVNAEIVQGDYNKGVNVFNYPYVTIFNKEDIFKYRNIKGL